MKRLSVLGILLSCLLLPACTTATKTLPNTESAPTCVPVSTEANPATDLGALPVLYGMWMNDQNEMLVFSEKSLYMVQVEGSTGASQLRETYFEVREINWAQDTLTLNMKWVRVNGQYGGFDMPLHSMKISITDNSLMYSLGDESSGIPEEALIGPFLKN